MKSHRYFTMTLSLRCVWCITSWSAASSRNNVMARSRTALGRPLVGRLTGRETGRGILIHGHIACLAMVEDDLEEFIAVIAKLGFADAVNETHLRAATRVALWRVRARWRR